MPPVTKKAVTLEGDGLSEVLWISTVPSTTAALLLLDAGKTHLVRQDDCRSEALSGDDNHRIHSRGRSKWSQALIHSHFISAVYVARDPCVTTLATADHV